MFAIKSSRNFMGKKKHIRQIASKERQLPSKRAMNLKTLRDDKSTLLKKMWKQNSLGTKDCYF